MAPRLGRLAVTQKHSNVDAAACPGTLVPNSLALGQYCNYHIYKPQRDTVLW